MVKKIIKFDYELLVQESLRSVVHHILTLTAQHGLPRQHHFYISFRTDHPGVDLPGYLQEQYPEEITIVLQYEYWDLEVESDRFFVTLCFNEMHERLTIPFASIVSFVDPSVKFGLQFTPTIHEKAPVEKFIAKSRYKPKVKETTPPSLPSQQINNGSNVIHLDSFRKK